MLGVKTVIGFLFCIVGILLIIYGIYLELFVLGFVFIGFFIESIIDYLINRNMIYYKKTN